MKQPLQLQVEKKNILWKNNKRKITQDGGASAAVQSPPANQELPIPPTEQGKK